ncbi:MULTISPECIES: hypothetical protein [unclassified Leeuwenhoekiella]|uniref:hypothetical protein n=1 Tax=unclassified Leeuwenhoekiella TaxID=2615029 RepID=UPI000C55468F|nr:MULTISPECIES: hypothetical protein [unclassified Leeuwenhoekiella]MAW94103.1 hypothetical protein [Leeuwenhoekiella sp.]MBA80858.1 hypothetical protein [Leeuwenhoekiella sp.]
MKEVYLILMLLALTACNSKKKNTSSLIETKNTEQEIQKRLNGREVVKKLEELSYFNLTDSTDLVEVKSEFEKAYTNLNFFQGPAQEESMTFKDNRYFWVDCEELFEIGGITTYLDQVKPTFKKLGLKLEYDNEQNQQNQNSWKHSIRLNGREYSAFDGQFSNQDWGIAYINFLNMLNFELKKQDSKEQFYPIACGNAGMFVLLTPEQFDFVKKNYPNDSEHPTTMTIWKQRNGL